MTAFVLPNLDQSTIDELRKRIPDMSEFNIPSIEKIGKDVGKTADQTLDRLLGRSSSPVWPWIAGSIALVAIVGAFAAWFTWFRRPGSVDALVDDDMGTWQAPTDGTGITGGIGDELARTDQAIDRSTSGALGTFGDRPVDEYPTA